MSFSQVDFGALSGIAGASAGISKEVLGFKIFRGRARRGVSEGVPTRRDE
jgi:hypothetical protein